MDGHWRAVSKGTRVPELQRPAALSTEERQPTAAGFEGFRSIPSYLIIYQQLSFFFFFFFPFKILRVALKRSLEEGGRCQG